MDSTKEASNVPDIETFLNVDYDISSIPPQWKKVLRDAGVKKKDLRDLETRRMIYELLKTHEDEVKAVNSPSYHPELRKTRSLSTRAAVSTSSDLYVDMPPEGELDEKDRNFFTVRDKKKRRYLLTRSRSIDEITRLHLAESPPSSSEEGSSSRNNSRPASPSSLNEKKKGSLRKMFATKKGSFFSLSASKLGLLPEKKPDDRIADHLNSLQSDTLLHTIANEIEKQDHWTSRPRVVYKWADVQDTEIHPCVANTFSNNCVAAGYHFEYGNRRVVVEPETFFIEDHENDIPFFREHFQNRLHMTLLYDGADDSMLGPVCISVEENQAEDKKAYMRTKKGNTRFIIPSQYATSKDIIKYIKTTYPELANVKFNEVYNDPDLLNKLLEYENQGIISKYKFGLLYVKEGQTDEDEMFSNTETSQDYEDFLDFLGDRIELQGWSHYRGGLDVKTNTTGQYSIYTKFRDQFEIMFHVSTMLPFQPDDKQRVERKRHLGNDIIMLIFKEGDEPFDPLCIKSHFNHIFAVVQVHEREHGRAISYKLSIANRTAVLPYGPWLPSPPIFKKNNEFRDFLFTKLVNSERAAMHSPDFKGKMLRTAKEMLTDIAREFGMKGRRKKHSISIPSELLSKTLMGTSSSPPSPLSSYTPTARSSPDRTVFNRGALSAPVAPNLAPFVVPKQKSNLKHSDTHRGSESPEPTLLFQMEPITPPVSESLLTKSSETKPDSTKDAPLASPVVSPASESDVSPETPTHLAQSSSKERMNKALPKDSPTAFKKIDTLRKSSSEGFVGPRTIPSWQTATYDAIKDSARANRMHGRKTIDISVFHASPPGKNLHKPTAKKPSVGSSFSDFNNKDVIQAIANTSLIGARNSLNNSPPIKAEKPLPFQVEEEIPNVTVLMDFQEKEEYLKMFDRADDDKDGLITGAQAASLLISSGLPKDELTKIWVLSDINSDRHFDREEFAIAQYLISQRKKGQAIPEVLPKKLMPMKRLWKLSVEEKHELTEAYKRIENNDHVSVTAFVESAASLTAQDLAKIFVLSDIGQDGFLSFDEFIVASMLAEFRKSGEQLGGHLPYALVHLVRTTLTPPVFQGSAPAPVEPTGAYLGPLTVVLQLTAKEGKEIQVRDFIKGNLSNRHSGQHLRVYRDIENAKSFHVQLNFDTDSLYQEWKSYTFNAIEKVQHYLLAEAPMYKKLEKL